MVFISLLLIGKIQAWRCSQGTSRAEIARINVRIEGFVERPGTYVFAQGVRIQEALKKARPKRFADLRAIDPQAPIVHSLDLDILPLETIQVEIRGAVKKPQSFALKPGTRLCQIKKIVELSEEADLAFFKKRHLLSDGQVIEVPKKC